MLYRDEFEERPAPDNQGVVELHATGHLRAEPCTICSGESSRQVCHCAGFRRYHWHGRVHVLTGGVLEARCAEHALTGQYGQETIRLAAP